MFRVTFRCGEAETTSSFYNYEYALKALIFLVKESERFRANGSIKKYSVELKKEV